MCINIIQIEDVYIYLSWFPLFNDISNFLGYLMPKPSLYKKCNGEIKGIHTFFNCINPKVNVIAQLVFEVANSNTAIKHVSHYMMLNFALSLCLSLCLSLSLFLILSHTHILSLSLPLTIYIYIYIYMRLFWRVFDHIEYFENSLLYVDLRNLQINEVMNSTFSIKYW